MSFLALTKRKTLKMTDAVNQVQTKDAFSFKWGKRDTYESPAMQAEWKRWLIEKYFDNELSKRDALFAGGRKKILDAGCGAGGSGLLLFNDVLPEHDYIGVDISDAVQVAQQRFAEQGISGTFLQSPLESIPADLGNFDIIFSEGVLHHTDCVERAIKVLAERLNVGGKFLFYVYVKKAPIREFTDDFVRQYIAAMDDESAWKALEPLTKLGKVLGDLNVEVDIPEDIPFLGIEKGRHNLQRLFFYKICKTYYRPDYNLQEMNHINFDWFRPANCFRHSPDEINEFCEEAGLIVERMHVGESGITVIATKDT